MSIWDQMSKAVGAASIDDLENIIYMDTGLPPLNKIMSGSFDGGLPNGKMIEIYGESSSGKTLIATNLMAAAQRKGGAACFIDFERSFDPKFAAKFGLDTKNAFGYFKPDSWETGNKNIIQFAQWVRTNKAIPEDAPIVAVLDSIAAAPAASTVAKDIDQLNMNDNTALARVTSTTFKSIKQFAERLNISLVYLNQTREAIDVMYGPKTKTPGGKAVIFFSDARFEVSRKVERDEKTKEMTGQLITIKNVKNKFCRPYQQFTIPFRFGDHGEVMFDTVVGTLGFAVERGLIKRNGSRIEWEGKSLYASEVAKQLKADPEGINKLVSLLLSRDTTVEDDRAAGCDEDIGAGADTVLDEAA